MGTTNTIIQDHSVYRTPNELMEYVAETETLNELRTCLDVEEDELDIDEFYGEVVHRAPMRLGAA